MQGAAIQKSIGVKKPGNPFLGGPGFLATTKPLVPTAGFEPGDLMITLHPLFQLS
jgi:hypothetical protein